MSIKKRVRTAISKVLSCTLILTILLGSFPPLVFAQEFEDVVDGDTETSEVEIADDLTDSADDVVGDEPAGDVEEEELTPEGEEEESESLEPADTNSESTWIETDGVWELSLPIVVGEEYSIDDLGGLKIVFSEVSVDEGKLFVSKSNVSAVLEEDEVVGDAYDLTSNMENGTFRYDLYLPVPGGVSDENLEVKYSEDGQEFQDVANDIVESGFVVVSGLDHFTTFVVVNPNPVGDGNTSGNQACTDDGGTAYTCYDTIQEAVNASVAGDTIEVQTGVYAETVIINKGISLTCEAGAILDGSGLANRDVAGITVSANNVTIQGCEITGYQKGIVSEDPLLNGGVSYSNIHISGNTIHDLYLWNTSDPWQARRSNGIQIGVDAENFLPFYNLGWTGHAITSFYPYAGLLINGNVITNTYAGVVLAGTSASQQILSNTITSSTVTAVTLNTASGVLVDSNALMGNVGTGVYLCSSRNGVWNDAYEVLTNDVLSPRDITITGNTISSNGTVNWGGVGNAQYEQKLNNGISLVSSWPGTVDISGNTITGNDAMANGTDNARGGNGVANFTSEQVDARDNSWGDVNGPRDPWSGDGSFSDTNPGSTSGDYAYGNVLYANSAIVAEYQLDYCFGIEASDDSGNGHNGTVNGGAEWTGGYNSRGLDFDGLNDYIDVGGIDLGTVHTISVWVNADDFSNASQNVVFGESSNRYALWFQDNNSLYYRAGTDWARFELSTPLSTGTWYHIVFVRNNTSVELYIDGVSQGSDTFTDNDSLVVNYIGKENAGGGTQYPFTGVLDEIRFYSGVLSSGEVAALHSGYGAQNSDDCTLDAPTGLGWNLRTMANPVGDYSDTSNLLACGGITNGDHPTYGDGRISYHWNAVDLDGYTVQYEKQWVYPGGDPNDSGDWHGAELWTTPYTNYRSFGSAQGTEGLWHNRVRAYVDYDGDGTPDLYSDWGDACAVTYDRTVPTIPGQMGWGTNVPPVGYQGDGAGIDNYVGCDGYITSTDPHYGNWGEADAEIAGLDRYERQLYYNGSYIGQFNSGNNYAGPFTPGSGGANGSDGEYYVRVRAIDNAGNTSVADTVWADTSTWNTNLNNGTDGSWCKMTIDTTTPTSTLFIQGDLDETRDLAHNNGWHGYGWYESFDNVNLRIDTGDTTDDFIQYQILSGDVACPAVGDAGYSHVAHDTNVSGDVNGTDGTYTLCYYAEDLAGNTEVPVNKEILRIDDTNPEYTITGANGIVVNESGRDIHYLNSDTPEIYTDVADNLSGYTRARYDLYTADDDWNCTYDHWNEDNLLPPSVSASRTFAESGLADGSYCYRVWVYDDVQNKSWSDTNGERWVYFVIDTVAPQISIDGIKYPDDTVVPTFITNYNTPVIVGSTTSTDVETIQLVVNGYTYDAVLSGSDWEVDITDILPDGTYIMSVMATDLAGNTTTETQELVVDTVAPTADHVFYKDGVAIDETVTPIAYVNDVNRLTFTAEYTDADPSSGLYWDSFVIFEAQDDGSFGFSANGKRAFCSWRRLPNLVEIPACAGSSYSLTTQREFTDCTDTLPDGEYYMAHHIYDNATRKDIPSINQFRDVLGLHFVVDTVAPAKPTGLHRRNVDNTSVYACGDIAQRQTLIPDWDDNTEDDFSHYEYSSFHPDGSQGLDEVVLNDSEMVHPWIPPVDGLYGYAVRAVDEAGNKSEWSLTEESLDGSCQITYDSTDPTADQMTDRTFVEGEAGVITLARGYDTNQVYFTVQVRYTDPLNGVTSPPSPLWADVIVHDKMTESPADSGIWERDIDGNDGHTDPTQDYVIDTSVYGMGSEGTYEIKYFVEDEAGNVSESYYVFYTIENVAPVATFGSDQTIDEGETAVFTGSFTDPSSVDTGDGLFDDSDWTVEVDYDEGDGYQSVETMSIPGDISELSHTYVNDGTYTVRLRVCEGSNDVDGDYLIDGEGECSVEQIVIVTVNNVIPAVNVTADPGTTVVEGTTVTLTANASGGNPALSYLWSGDCTGTEMTTTVSNAPGTYVCTVTVTDVDGDVATDTVTVVVNALPPAPPAPAGNNEGGYVPAVLGADVEADQDEDEGQEEDEDGEVLGERTCREKMTISGYVFIDQNDNDEMDGDENGVENVDITVYYFDEDNERVDVVTVRTDANGYWEVDLCPGDYKVKVDTGDLPEDTGVEKEVLSIDVKDGEDLEDTNFVINELSKGFNWWLCLIPLIILAVLMLVTYFLTQRKKEDEK